MDEDKNPHNFFGKVPIVAVEGIVIEDDKVAMIKRTSKAFQGYWAIPGGVLEYGERIEDCAVREVLEETGLEVKIKKLFGIYDDPNKDPRGHTVTIVFLCEKIGGELTINEEASEVKWFEKGNLPEKIAFNHREVLKDAGFE